MDVYYSFLVLKFFVQVLKKMSDEPQKAVRHLSFLKVVRIAFTYILIIIIYFSNLYDVILLNVSLHQGDTVNLMHAGTKRK